MIQYVPSSRSPGQQQATMIHRREDIVRQMNQSRDAMFVLFEDTNRIALSRILPYVHSSKRSNSYQIEFPYAHNILDIHILFS